MSAECEIHGTDLYIRGGKGWPPETGCTECDLAAAESLIRELVEALVFLREYAGSYESLQNVRGYPPPDWAAQKGQELEALVAKARQLIGEGLTRDNELIGYGELTACPLCGGELRPLTQAQYKTEFGDD